jgi:callose synthase
MFFLVLEDVRWFWQEGNVKNQREHLVLLLANAQMRLQPQATNRLDAKVVKKIRKKVTANYVSWCNFIRQRSNLELTEEDERLELLYTALFLLIWGESANLRFMPECLCYMFHHMSRELNRMLNRSIDEHSAMPAKPKYSEPNDFLNKVVTPLYKAIQAVRKVSSLVCSLFCFIAVADEKVKEYCHCIR